MAKKVTIFVEPAVSRLMKNLFPMSAPAETAAKVRAMLRQVVDEVG